VGNYTGMLMSIIELASIYSLVTLGLIFSLRMVGFADLTIESSFTTGAAVSALLLSKFGMSPALVVLIGGTAGALAGLFTSLLHVRGKISKLLSGIIMMTVLYSVNLRIMGRSNIQLLSYDTVFSTMGRETRVVVLLLGALLLYLLSWFFLKSRFGYFLRTCGENPTVVKKLQGSTDALIFVSLMLSNFLTASAGALAAQLFGYADIGMGTGLIVIAFAALILGEAVCSPKSILRLLVAAFIGTILYRTAYDVGLRMNVHPWNLKIAVGVFLAAALIIKRWFSKKTGKLMVGVEGL